MAILNGVEGQAHVIFEDDDTNWNGYIVLEPDPANLRFFDVFGPRSRVVYEGPVMRKGAYYFGHGTVRILKVSYSMEPAQLRVEFKGVEARKEIKALADVPEDYLP